MIDYKKLVLKKLIENYKNKKTINFVFSQNTIKEYYNPFNIKAKEEIDIACFNLEKEGYIKVFKGISFNKHNIERLQINPDKIEEISLNI